jgi:hypothetical protein
MKFKERKKQNSADTSMGVAIERNEKKYRYRKMSIMVRCRGC